MATKWWLNWRKPSVQYNTAMVHSVVSGHPPSPFNSAWTAATPSAGRPTATAHASQAWLPAPVSMLRATVRAHRSSASMTGLRGATGHTCSSSKVITMASKIIR